MKKQHPNHNSNDHLLEEDAVWDLLEQAPPAQPGPLFSRNVLREIRLEEQSPPAWLSFLKKPQLTLPAFAALAIGITTLLFKLDSPDSELAHNETTTTSETTQLQAYVEEELLLAAAEDPDLFSDEELVALLF